MMTDRSSFPYELKLVKTVRSLLGYTPFFRSEGIGGRYISWAWMIFLRLAIPALPKRE